ncbi:MAG: DPP IV N-terminal domain-containing protein [Planctomycetota bacterium]
MLPPGSTCLTLLALAGALHAQARTLSLDAVLDQPERLAPDLPKAQWTRDAARYSLVLDGRTGPYVVDVDARTGDRRHAFAAADLARALRAAGAECEDAPLPAFDWVDGETVRVEHGSAVYLWRVGEPAASVRLRLPPAATASACAPHDRFAASVVDADLWISKPDGSRRRITWDGRAADIEYGLAAHRSEFGIDRGLFTDPLGRRLAFYREDLRPIAAYPFIDYTKSPPLAARGRYPMAGQSDSVVTVGVYDSEDDSIRFLEHDPDADDYWTNVCFTPDGAEVLLGLVNRGQDHLQVAAFDAATGRRRATLFEEHDSQWVEPEHAPWFEPGGGRRFLWLSPRDGHRHLYRYDLDGHLLGQVTRGAIDVEEVIAFAGDGTHVYVQATGEDARQTHLWRAALDGSRMERLTEGGRHFATANADASLFFDRYESLLDPGGLRVVAADGKALGEVGTTHTGLRAFALGERRFFDVEAADGTVLHGVMTLPPGFDPSRRYPLLLYVYGGPHSQLVTDSWGRADARALWLEWMASQGCIVATLDNRGTRNRGIEFEQVVHRHLGRVEVEDQVAAVRHLLALGFVDGSRVGVHGWSYGGYMTLRLMLSAPDLFCCGAAGAPVTDWRGYETGYTERFMDTPQENPEGYDESRALAVDHLRGRLLLVHGSDDRTVMLSHAMTFLDRAVANGVLVDSMIYPQQKHGLVGASRAHLYRLLSRFFGEHLLASSPAPRSDPK